MLIKNITRINNQNLFKTSAFIHIPTGIIQDAVELTPKIQIPLGKKLTKNQLYHLNIDDKNLKICIGNKEFLHINNMTLQSKCHMLKNGEYITIGSTDGMADIIISSKNTEVAPKHAIIRKLKNEYYIQATHDTTVTKIANPPKLNEAQNVSDLHYKVQEQIAPITNTDVRVAIEKVISQIPDTNVKEVMTVMQKISQFGSYSCFKNLSKQLEEKSIKGFGTDGPISLNSCFAYLYQKHIFSMPYLENGKKAYILDEYFLNNLEKMKKSSPSNFESLVNNKQNVFINLDGWNSGINIFNANADIADITINILNKIKKLKSKKCELSFEDMANAVINQPVLDRGKKLGIKPINISNTDSNTEIVSIKQIVNQLNPLNISNKEMHAVIDSILKFNQINTEDYDLAKKLLIKYFDEQANVFSPKRIAKNLIEQHRQITKMLRENGRNLDEVYYIIPNKTSSFGQVAYNYAVLNKINPDKIICDYQRTTCSLAPKDATFIILDDMVGSGASMIEEKFDYDLFSNIAQSTQSLIFAPMICCEDGAKVINRTIKQKQRNGLDRLIPGIKIQDRIENNKLFTEANNKEKSLLYKVLGNLGFENAGLCNILPYMGPDNNTTIASLLGQFFVPNAACLKTKLPMSYNNELISELKSIGVSTDHINKDCAA